MARRHLIACALAVAAAAPAACSNDEPGIVVNVDLAGFDVQTLKVVLGASGGGFKAQAGTNVQGVGVTTEDVDGDGALDLVTEFLHPQGPISFRVATGNMTMLDVTAHAIAFDATKLIAAADTAAPIALPPGTRTAIALTLAEKTGGAVGPTTRTTDILTASADVTVKTTAAAAFSSVAVCDVDDDGNDDLILGAPQAESMNLNGVGAVYVLLGAGGFSSEIDPAKPTSFMGFSFTGLESGDRLGATVACADLNGDHVDDLIVGAPGAALGTGQVYAVFGRMQIRNRTIAPGTTGTNAPDITWRTGVDAGFGGILSVADLNHDGKAEILVASSGKVHLLKNVTETTLGAISVDAADHITFSHVSATSLTAGDLQEKDGVDVIIGDSAATKPGVTMGGGAIFGFANVDLASTTQYDALSPSTVIYGDKGMLFGAAVLALSTTSNRGQDLIVGAPGAKDGTGAFYVYRSDNNFFGTNPRDINDFQTFKDGPLAGGRFGTSLAGTPTGSAPSNKWDLLVGAPDTRRSDSRPLAGAAYLFGGGDGWLFPLYEQLFGASAGDGLGTVVAGGQVDSDLTGDLVTIAPGATDGDTANPGIVYVRFGRARQ